MIHAEELEDLVDRLVRRLFAKPSMRRRPYPMLLDEKGDATAEIPSEEDRATLLFLDDLRIMRIEHLDSAAAVRSALGAGEGGGP